MQVPYFLERCLYGHSIQICCPTEWCDVLPPSANEWQTPWLRIWEPWAVRDALYFHSNSSQTATAHLNRELVKVLWTTYCWQSRCFWCFTSSSSLKAYEVHWHHLATNIRSPRSHNRGPCCKLLPIPTYLRFPEKWSGDEEEERMLAWEYPLHWTGEKLLPIYLQWQGRREH